jgi:hypothetical protein
MKQGYIILLVLVCLFAVIAHIYMKPKQMRERFVLQDRVKMIGAVAHSKVRSVLVQGIFDDNLIFY